MTNPKPLEPGPDAPHVVRVLVEVPKGSRNKYEVDPATGAILLDRYLFASSHYPGDYGFVPGTLAEDGDPLDVLVLVHEATFSGCLIDARVVGVFRMTDQGKADHKVLGVPARDPHLGDVRELADVGAPLLREIEHFFTTYKQLEGAAVVGGGWGDAEEARGIVRASIEAHAGGGRP